jgi:hypothetical protein
MLQYESERRLVLLGRQIGIKLSEPLIEMPFKYYKQHLNLGKSHFRILGAIQSSLYCVAIVGLLVALYSPSLTRKISFKRAVKQIMSVFSTRKPLYI